MTVNGNAPAVPAGAAERSPARTVAAGFESLLFQLALAPLAKPLGFFGEAVTGAVARRIAEQANDPLAQRLESFLESAR